MSLTITPGARFSAIMGIGLSASNALPLIPDLMSPMLASSFSMKGITGSIAANRLSY